MSFAPPRGKAQWCAENTAQTTLACRDEDAHGGEDRCSYEEKRDKRVAKMKELMKPLEQASREM